MPRTAAKVTQADIARVLRAVAQSGMKMSVQIASNGTIRLDPAETAEKPRFDRKVPVDL